MSDTLTPEQASERLRALEATTARIEADRRAASEREAFAGSDRISERDAGVFLRNGSVRMRGAVEGSGGDAQWCPGLLDSDAPRLGDWHKDLCQAVEERSMIRLHAPAASVARWDSRIAGLLASAPGSLRDSKQAALCRADNGARARIFTDGTNVGAEFIPDIMLPILTEKMRSERKIEALFEVINATTNTVDLPRITNGGLRPYKYGAQTSDSPVAYTASSLATDKRNYTIPRMATRTVWDDDSAADSVIAMLPVLQSELSRSLVDGFEDAIINGDTASTHGDTIADWDIRGRWGTTGLGGAADHRRTVLGLRARALDIGASVTDDISTLTAAKLIALRANHAAGTSDSDLVWIVSPEAFYGSLWGLAELLTMDKFGPQATIVTGQIARIFGIPVVISDFVGGDMNASGIFDNVTETKTGILLVNRSRHKVISRRGAVIAQEADIDTGTTRGVISVRKGFTHLGADTEASVSYGYNL